MRIPTAGSLDPIPDRLIGRGTGPAVERDRPAGAGVPGTSAPPQPDRRAPGLASAGAELAADARVSEDRDLEAHLPAEALARSSHRLMTTPNRSPTIPNRMGPWGIARVRWNSAGSGDAAACIAPSPSPSRVASTPHVIAYRDRSEEKTQVRSRTNRMRVAARLATTSIATSTDRDGAETRPCSASSEPLVMPSVITNTTRPWS
jgi:hypothetical protein